MKNSKRSTTNKHLSMMVLACVAFFWTSVPAKAQTPSETYQRSFPHSTEALQAAIHTVQPLTRGRLPILDGFVISQDAPLESYSRGYYECTLQILSGSSGENIIRASAKITAWYTDPEASRSGYRVLPSNGRLENDALDRIDEALADATVGNSSASFSSSAKAPSGTKPAGGIGPSTVVARPAPTPAVPPAASSSASNESIETIRAHRVANEKRAAELAVEEKNLEEILNSQSRPTDLVVVKRSATPIFSKAAEDAQVLMSADAHDEFQLLGLDGQWIHVQISGASRGWIRRAQVKLPASYGGGGIVDAGQATPVGTPPSTSAFKIEKEETSKFGGKWEPLSGKNVRVVWAAPSSGQPTSGDEKKSFAKEIFLKAYSDQKSADPPIEGVVLLFDSADGGQIAATVASLQKLEDGSLAGPSFWKQCSLDPPELLVEPAKHVAKIPEGKN
jgi:hypothetical protein